MKPVIKSYNKLVILSLSILLLLVIPPAVTGDVIDSAAFTSTITLYRDYQEYLVTVEENGSILEIEMRATSGDLDTLLYLINDRGEIIAENDDDSRQDGTTDSYILYKNAEAGVYTIIATRYGVNTGTTSGDYLLEYRFLEAEPDLPAYDVSVEALLTAGYPEISPRPAADWTVLAYYGGDSDLEAFVLRDLEEFERAAAGDNIHTLVMVDRHEEYSTERGNWTSTRIYEASAAPETPLVDLGDLDTGNGLTLAQFLVWGIQNFPAENYVIAFGSHGAGWKGVITDNSPVRSIITLPQIDQAFRVATEATGIEHFDLLINDACLMSSVEYFTTIMPYVQMTYASPEIVVSPALNMTDFAEALNQPEIDLATLGQQLSDRYIQRDINERPLPTNGYMTQAVTRLTDFDPVVQAVENFARTINDNPVLYRAIIGNARQNTYTYTGFMGYETQIDLGNFMNQVIESTQNAVLVGAARRVLTALDNARSYATAGPLADSISYYNIYFPADASDFQLRYFDESPLLAWGQMLRNYFNASTPRLWTLEGERQLTFHDPTAPQIRITGSYPPVSSIHNPAVMDMELSGRSLDSVHYTLEKLESDGSVERLITGILQKSDLPGSQARINNWSAGVDFARFILRPAIPAVTDGNNIAFAHLEYSGETIFLEGRYSSPATLNWRDVTILFNQDGSVQRIISETEEDGALAEVEIPGSSIFQVYRYSVTPDGQIRKVPGTYFDWDSQDFRLNFDVSLLPGDYRVGFEVQSFGGASAFDSIRITVADENLVLDPELHGHTGMRMGITTLYPSDWDGLTLSRDDLIEGYSPSGDAWIGIQKIDFVSGMLREPSSFAKQYLQKTVVRQTSEMEAIVVDGYRAVRFDISSGFGTDTWIGQVFVLSHPSGWGLAVQAMSPQAAGDAYRSVFETLETTTRFFDPALVETVYRNLWTEDTVTAGERQGIFPVRYDWYWFKEQQGIWQSYDPRDGVTFMRVAHLPRTRVSDGTFNEILSEYVLWNDRAEITQIQDYYAENLTWRVASYTYFIGKRKFTGRLYLTQSNADVFAFWLESRDNDYGRRLINDFIELSVDGFRIQSLVREKTDPVSRVTLVHPSDWFEAWYTAIDEQRGYWSSRPIEAYNYVKLYRDTSLETCTPDTSLETFLSNYGYTRSGVTRPIEFNGLTGIEFSAVYTIDGQSFILRGRAICSDNTGVVLTAEVPVESLVLEAIFENVEASYLAADTGESDEE